MHLTNVTRMDSYQSKICTTAKDEKQQIEHKEGEHKSTGVPAKDPPEPQPYEQVAICSKVLNQSTDPFIKKNGKMRGTKPRQSSRRPDGSP